MKDESMMNERYGNLSRESQKNLSEIRDQGEFKKQDEGQCRTVILRMTVCPAVTIFIR